LLVSNVVAAVAVPPFALIFINPAWKFAA